MAVAIKMNTGFYLKGQHTLPFNLHLFLLQIILNSCKYFCTPLDQKHSFIYSMTSYINNKHDAPKNLYITLHTHQSSGDQPSNNKQTCLAHKIDFDCNFFCQQIWIRKLSVYPFFEQEQLTEKTETWVPQNDFNSNLCIATIDDWRATLLSIIKKKI